MKIESTLERIRRVRHEISEECDHDPKKLVAYFQKLQQDHRDKLVSRKTDQSEGVLLKDAA
ncbi:MAG: hypothetical protein KAJ81_10185 [Candidatus Latescibacteria bacterium]|nr:hypothetical protein [Candidatus Latescibacterota bacterium]